jgi:hypothetical protein
MCFVYFKMAITRLYRIVTYFFLLQEELRWSERKRQCGGYSGTVERGKTVGEEQRRSRKRWHIGGYLPNYTAFPSTLISKIKYFCLFILPLLFLSFSLFIRSFYFALSFLRPAFLSVFPNICHPFLCLYFYCAFYCFLCLSSFYCLLYFAYSMYSHSIIYLRRLASVLSFLFFSVCF